MSDEILSGIRETLRTALIAVVPLAIIQLQANTLDYKVLGVALAIGILRGIEQWLHKKDITTGLEFKMIK